MNQSGGIPDILPQGAADGLNHPPNLKAVPAAFDAFSQIVAQQHMSYPRINPMTPLDARMKEIAEVPFPGERIAEGAQTKAQNLPFGHRRGTAGSTQAGLQLVRDFIPETVEHQVTQPHERSCDVDFFDPAGELGGGKTSGLDRAMQGLDPFADDPFPARTPEDLFNQRGSAAQLSDAAVTQPHDRPLSGRDAHCVRLVVGAVGELQDLDGEGDILQNPLGQVSERAPVAGGKSLDAIHRARENRHFPITQA